MSVELIVVAPYLPPREDWQARIDQLGFDVRLDPQIDLSSKGFVPVFLQSHRRDSKPASKMQPP